MSYIFLKILLKNTQNHTVNTVNNETIASQSGICIFCHFILTQFYKVTKMFIKPYDSHMNHPQRPVITVPHLSLQLLGYVFMTLVCYFVCVNCLICMVFFYLRHKKQTGTSHHIMTLCPVQLCMCLQISLPLIPPSLTRSCLLSGVIIRTSSAPVFFFQTTLLCSPSACCIFAL